MLRKINDKSKGATVAKGEIVYIEPKKSHWQGNMMQHKLVRDESLYDISQSYGIKLKALAKMNKLSVDEKLKKGYIIRLK